MFLFKNTHKFIIVLAATLVLAISTSFEIRDGIKWKDSKAIESINAKDPRPIIIEVYADWCGWCIKLHKTTFSGSLVVNYINTNYHAFRINGDDNYNFEFLGKIFTPRQLIRELKIEGYPTLLFLDKKMKLVKVAPGYKTSTQFMRMLRKYSD